MDARTYEGRFTLSLPTGTRAESPLTSGWQVVRQTGRLLSCNSASLVSKVQPYLGC
jgi:hypothetical protein